MKHLSIVLLCSVLCTALTAAPLSMTSPNGRLTLDTQDGTYTVSYQNQAVLQIASLGYMDIALQARPRWKFAGKVKADYTMLAGKCFHPVNTANEYRAKLAKNLQLVLRLYNDGVAFRYEFSGLQEGTLPKEQTSYRIPEGTRRWMMQWSDGYEGFFPLSTTGQTANRRWGYPALLEPVADTFVLLSEANIERRQSASCLYNDEAAEYYRVVPDQNTVAVSGDWHSPWRVAIIGSLADVVESTLITDVSEPCQLKDTEWIRPGVVSWIYWAYNHGSNDMNIIKKYVDMAATLHLPYVLIDAEWDEMKDGKRIEEAIDYAKAKGVRPLIWYNSSVGWVDGAPGPKFRLNKAEDREREFAWCEQLGVAGVKIDFFSGDNQLNMDYSLDLLTCAAKHHLLVNFHGATIPRGWQRTYPNLLSTEGVYGAEWYNNVPTFTQKAAAHNAILPFTRNVIGPMDYTPCAFSDSQHPHITSNAHELALTVLFESGLQHLADKPESYYAQPAEVQQFFSALPTAWDETRLLSGYPAERVVMARRRGHTWYVAGINGTDEAIELTIDQKFLHGQAVRSVTLFADGSPWDISHPSTLPTTMKCQPRGGFVAVVEMVPHNYTSE
ncbi:MAG: glycoside hydrolase family 97 protein [Bacteroidaceae bacterium]|nr:glycoside hydrolase family 97 protein [Bacteroidaceae bacterium]